MQIGPPSASLFPGLIATVLVRAETIDQACALLRETLQRAYGAEWASDRKMKTPVQIAVHIDRVKDFAPCV